MVGFGCVEPGFFDKTGEAHDRQKESPAAFAAFRFQVALETIKGAGGGRTVVRVELQASQSQTC